MTAAKKWKTGTADEVWKLHICSRDASRAEDIASGLSYIMTNAGHVSFEGALQAIEDFSGAEIARALFDYREAALASIQRALPAPPQSPTPQGGEE